MKNSEFYDLLAANYDEMINFESSLKNKIEYLSDFISPKFERALDLGCGTGADSIALAKSDLKVDAVDHSHEMLKKAKINSKNNGTEINFFRSSIVEFNIEQSKYDIIVSLGNTLPNIPKYKLGLLFMNMTKSLNYNGRIVIQIINYSKFPKSGNLILKTFENDKISIIRRYNFNNDNLDFVIDIKDKEKNREDSLITQLYRHTLDELTEYSRRNKFRHEIFGNLMKESYLETKSENIVLVLSK